LFPDYIQFCRIIKKIAVAWRLKNPTGHMMRLLNIWSVAERVLVLLSGNPPSAGTHALELFWVQGVTCLSNI
jgi:hypothetical protein